MPPGFVSGTPLCDPSRSNRDTGMGANGRPARKEVDRKRLNAGGGGTGRGVLF